MRSGAELGLCARQSFSAAPLEEHSLAAGRRGFLKATTSSCRGRTERWTTAGEGSAPPSGEQSSPHRVSPAYIFLVPLGPKFPLGAVEVLAVRDIPQRRAGTQEPRLQGTEETAVERGGHFSSQGILCTHAGPMHFCPHSKPCSFG